jgi:acyl carrier protein
MDDTQARLIKCFASVFPKLRPDEIVHASQASVEEWDSIVTVTLLTVIEEEFGFAFSLDEMEELTGFQPILNRLQEAASRS